MSNQQIELYVANLDCENEAAAIERGLRDAAGVTDLQVYAKAAKVAIAFDPDKTSASVLRERLEVLGFPAQEGRTAPGQPPILRNPKVLASLASGVLLLIGYLGSKLGLPGLASMGLYITAAVVGGYYFFKEAGEVLVHDRRVGIDLLMAVATIVAVLLGETAEGAMLAFLYSISEAAEGYTEEKTRSAIRALMELAPKIATVKRDGQEVEVPVEAIAVGEVFLVRPGQAVATDGVVLSGTSGVNQAPVTGESMPVTKRPEDQVFAGSINGEGALEVRATRTAADNTIAKIIHMVEEAQEQKGKSQRFIERFGNVYSPIVLLIGILIAVVPPGLLHMDWMTWLARATVFVVAAAPCALVISIPITLVAALGTGARNGVLIKGGVYLEELAKVRVVAMDKTGTITSGMPEVTDIVPLEGPGSPAIGEVIAFAASVERPSQHPLARAVTRYATGQGIAVQETTDFTSMTGAGASARVKGRIVYVGSPDYFADRLGHDLGPVGDTISRLQSEGKTVILVGDDKAAWALIAIRDQIRDAAKKAIADLHAAGITKVVMLTGDNERTARAIAKEVGIDEVFADLKPEDKVARVRELEAHYGHVAMVGDGVNDAPALAEASVGIAMGTAGTDVALETADVALMADELDRLVYAFRLARRNQAVVHQNLVLSALVIGVLVVGAIAGAFSLPVAVLGHELSEFVVIASGLRMLRA